MGCCSYVFFFQAKDGIRYYKVTGVQTCALPIWRRDAARREVRYRQLPRAGNPPHQLARRTQVLGLGHQLFGAERGPALDPGHERTHVTHGLDDVPGAGLTLRPDHGRALTDAPQRLAEVATTTHERNAEGEFVDVEVFVGRGQHFRLVDIADGEGLQDLGFHEVADPGLGHHGDGDRLLDLLDFLHRRHPGHAAVAPDVRGHTLESHHRRGARVFRDLRLLGVRHVHDDAALQHLGQSDVLAIRDPQSVEFRHVPSPCIGVRAPAPRRDYPRWFITHPISTVTLRDAVP